MKVDFFTIAGHSEGECLMGVPKMPQYNDMFELSVEDISLIEDSLRKAMASLSHANPDEIEGERAERQNALRRIQDLLGRLHDQKIFYRPRSGVYLGG